MAEKLEDFYNVLKSNPSIKGLPEDYSSFKRGLSDLKNAEGFFKVISSNESIKGLPSDFETFATGLGLKKKDLSQSGSMDGSKPSQDTKTGAPFTKANIDSPFDYTDQNYASKVQEKEAKDKAAFEQGKKLVAPYNQRNKQFNSITPSAVHTKRYRSADGDIMEIDDPQSYLSNAYTLAAYNQIPSTVKGLLDKNPTQKLALVKEISENPELRSKLTKYGSTMRQSEYRSEIKNILAKEAVKRNEKFKALESSGMQEKLNKASVTSDALKIKIDELKALDTQNNFIKNTISNSAGDKAIVDGIKNLKKEIDLYSPEVDGLNKLSKDIESQNLTFETKYGKYKDASGKFIISDPILVDEFNSDASKLQGLYNTYEAKVSSPEYKKYSENITKYNELIGKQERANASVLKASQQYNANLKKREKIVGEISALSSELSKYDALNKYLSEYRKLDNENKEYLFVVGDKPLSGALLQRLPQEYSRELSKLSKAIDDINSGSFMSPTAEFTGRLLTSTADMFYKIGGNALGIIGDINQEYQSLVGAGNKNEYTWFDLQRDRSLDLMKVSGPQFIDRPGIDPKTGDIIWSNIPYVAASSSGSMVANILIGMATGGTSAEAIVLPTYLSTIGDRYREAKEMDLNENQSFVYANSLAMLEGLSELIMPDYDLYKGLQKAAFADFIKSGKEVSIKSATDYVFKKGLVDIPKEVLEEYIVNAGEILNKSSILLAEGKLNKDTFINTLGNPKDYVVTALSTALIPAGMKALTAGSQGRSMYNAIMYDASKNLSASQQAVSNLVDGGYLTETQADQINKDLVRYSAVNSVLPEDIIAEKAVLVTPLLEKVQDLKAKVAQSSVDAVKATYSTQINEINKKIQDVLLRPNSDFTVPSRVDEVKSELAIEDIEALESKREQLKIKLTQPTVAAQEEESFVDTDLTEDQKTIAKQYKERLSKLKKEDPDQYWSVDLPDDATIADAIKNDRLVDVGGGMGIVTEDGNMIGMFKYDKSAKGTAKAVQEARIKKGGVKLDNFDGYLTRTYQKNGFRVVARVPFNEEFAPEGWNKEKHGTPDVVMMVYDPENKLDIEEKTFTDPNTGYEDAQAYRDSFVEEAIKITAPAEKVEAVSEEQVVAPKEPTKEIVKVKKAKKPSKEEKNLSRVTEDITKDEALVERNIIDIENKEQEIKDEKANLDANIKELKQKIDDIKKKKISDEEKEEQITEVEYDIEDAKGTYDVLYENNMADIKEMKAENKKIEKRLITSKLKQEEYASKIKPKQEQEGSKQDNKPKRERVKSTRKQAEKPKADSGDSDISGKKAEKITDINAKFVEVSKLYEKTREAKSPAEKTTANRKLSAFLNLNPTVKYIFENMNELGKQLGDRFKKNSFCP